MTPTEDLSEAVLHRLNEEQHHEIAPHTCVVCQRLIFGVDLYEQKISIHEAGRQIGAGITFADCIDGAQSGCAFCSYIVAVDTARFGSRMRPNSFKPSDDILWTTRFREAQNGPFLYISRGKHNDLRSTTENRRSNRQIGKFQLYAVPEHARLQTMPIAAESDCQRLLNSFLPPNLVPDSELSVRRAHAWLQECESNHHRCQTYQKRFTPKRLIEISGDGHTARIQSQHMAAVRYAALSYCWGGDQPLKAKKDNIQALSEFFDVTSFPMTIQDSIKIASKLGFRFLWVDALCIVQDDKDDVAEQIAQMHKIYTGSTLTISAASATAASQGFLQPRTFWRPTVLAARTQSGEQFQMLAVPADTHHDSNVYDNPLFERAWAYQENQVSGRILSFGLRAMAFFCLESEQQDGGNYKVDFDSYFGESVANAGFLNAGMKSLSIAEHPRAWTELITTYTTLGLWVPSDRLPALGAMAEEYGRRASVTKYLAGMWLEDFPYQLLWSSIDEDSASRPPVYCGPSWSWCSIIGRVKYYHHYKELEDLTFPCTVETASTHLLSGDYAYGRVDRGILVLRGRVRELIWINRKRRGPNNCCRAVEGSDKYMEIRRDVETDSRLEVNVDVPSEWPPEEDVPLSAVEIGRYRDNFSEDFDTTYVRALLLQEVKDGEKENVYRRAGLLYVSYQTRTEENWFDEGSKEMAVTVI